MTAEMTDIWKDDTLGRKVDADFLIRFLLARLDERGRQKLPRSYVLNIDAGWGGGKTFFMTRLGQQLRNHGFSVAQVDAWQDDHADDPLLSLMSAIESEITPLVRGDRALQSTYKSIKKAGLAIAGAGLKGLAKQGARKLLGEAVDTITAEIEALKEAKSDEIKNKISDAVDKTIEKSTDELLAQFDESKQSILLFKESMILLTNKIREQKNNWILFVLIDELDRCRPTYTISLLERIKHLFNADHVVFVLATDTDQLSESVKSVYGGGFHGKKYLTRFFDRSYAFSAPPLEKFIAASLSVSTIDLNKISLPPGVGLPDLIMASFQTFRCQPREINRGIELLTDVVSAWTYKSKIEAAVMVPLIAAHSSLALNITAPDFYPRCSDVVISSEYLRSMTIKFRSRITENISQVSLATLFENFRVYMPDLYKACFNEDSNPDALWITSRFSEELTLVHDSTIDRSRVMPSVMSQYPAIVAAAGRLQSI